MHNTSYHPRILQIVSEKDLAAELGRIGVLQPGVAVTLPKAHCYVVKLTGVSAAHARVIRETLVSVGGDAAVDPRVETGEVESSDMILVGTRKQYTTVARMLGVANGAGSAVSAEIESTIVLFESGPILPDDTVTTDAKVLRMYADMEKRALVMGILNITPDSFSDGGEFLTRDAALRHALSMVEDGADIVDIGGESSRPGSEPISAEEEIKRVVPIVQDLAKNLDKPISIDTYRATTAAAALDAGASIVNDISGMSFDPGMRTLAAERRCPVVIMHIKDSPKDMQKSPAYEDLMGEITDFLKVRIAEAVDAGVDERLIIVDPGFGFGKTVDHNLEMLRRLGEFRSLARPILIGTSRKSTIGQVLGGLPPKERIEGTAATVALSIAAGANIVRVHDVKEMARVAKMTEAIIRP
jgi:dihydropteroate synthase